MYRAVDSTSHDEAPRENNRPAAALFFLAFVIVCAFFTLNLFIGVVSVVASPVRARSGSGRGVAQVIDNFNRLKNQYDGSAFLTSGALDEWCEDCGH